MVMSLYQVVVAHGKSPNIGGHPVQKEAAGEDLCSQSDSARCMGTNISSRKELELRIARLKRKMP